MSSTHISGSSWSRNNTSQPSRLNPSRYCKKTQVCPPCLAFWASDPEITILLAMNPGSTILNPNDCLPQSLCRRPNRIASNEAPDLVWYYEWSTERATTNLSKHSLSILLHALSVLLA